MGVTSQQRWRREGGEIPRPVRPPSVVTWEVHQAELITARRDAFAQGKAAGGMTATVDVTGVDEVTAALDEATAMLSKAASENEALAKQVVELESMLDEATKAAPAKSDDDTKPGRPAPKRGTGKSGNK